MTVHDCDCKHREHLCINVPALFFPPIHLPDCSSHQGTAGLPCCHTGSLGGIGCSPDNSCNLMVTRVRNPPGNMFQSREDARQNQGGRE